MKVDFHVHSTASDGTCEPAELMALAHGFAAVALTDHDTCDGVAGLSDCEFSPDNMPLRVPGVELSIEAGEGFDVFHLLGLGIDPADAGLNDLLNALRRARRVRNAQIVENFHRLGIGLEGLDDFAHGEILARPHFARWLVDHGHAESIAEAFARYLLPDSPKATRCYEERWRPSQEDAFRVIHAAGGLCVMAHPKYWRRKWKSEGCDFAAAEKGLASLKEKGLDGVEALYQANTNEENVAFTRMATRLGYLLSAGSDFHGKNKPAIMLGMDVTDRYIGPLLEQLATCCDTRRKNMV